MTNNIVELSGIGKKKASLFAKLDLVTTSDLIYYTPQRYEDRTQISQIKSIDFEGKYSFLVDVISYEKKMTSKRKQMHIYYVSDGSAQLKIIFIASPYINQFFHCGERYYIYGQVKLNGMEKIIFHPEFKKASEGSFGIESIYGLTDGLTQRDFKKCLQQVESEILAVEEYLPQNFIDDFDLITLSKALFTAHFPENMEWLELAQRRLKYGEIFDLQAALKLEKLEIADQAKSRTYNSVNYDYNNLFAFELTDDQKQAIEEIINDLNSPRLMQRLLQGDVGSGKTAVAIAIADFVVKSGYQTALMVPTEILAQQHYQSFISVLPNLSIACLTSSVREKKKLYDEIVDGEYDIIIGTHALIQQSVNFKNLGLVITDEQHRFGVNQRQALSAKSLSTPDVLVMSATPIPRTLSLIIYGDMHISQIRQMPLGRKKVKTHYVKGSKYQAMLDFIAEKIALGQQAYFVAPLISESDKLDLKPAEEWYSELKVRFAPYEVALIHGKLKPDEKSEIMQSFSDGNIKVLVATTVIEVGVDVPKATIIVIGHSERFGLAQLHQLRGRVGRGDLQSYCFLLAKNAGKIAQARIKMLVKSNDGFEIANKDLELRGPGEILGMRQHGLPDLKYIDLNRDLEIIQEISDYIDELMNENLLPADYLDYLRKKLAL